MSPTDELILSVRSVLALLSVLPGLWIAGRFVRRASLWDAQIGAASPVLGRLPGLAMWLALGFLFASPLIDLVDLMSSLFLVFAPSSLIPSFSVLWGSASYWLHVALTSLLLVASYALAVWGGSALLRSLRGRLFPQRPLSAVEKAFCLLALGALVSRFTETLVGGIVGAQFPALYGVLYSLGLYGSGGYAAGWILAIAGMGVVVWILVSRLGTFRRQEGVPAQR